VTSHCFTVERGGGTSTESGRFQVGISMISLVTDAILVDSVDSVTISLDSVVILAATDVISVGSVDSVVISVGSVNQ
jgi:hypothetical protein